MSRRGRFAIAIAVVALTLLGRDALAPAQERAAGGTPAAARRTGPGSVAPGATRVRPEVFITIPPEDTSGVVFPFGGSHPRIPGGVTVNRAPYYCAPHARAFRDRATFVAHLRTRHGLDESTIPHALLVDGGQVRYVGK